jgi:hypothetical protein
MSIIAVLTAFMVQPRWGGLAYLFVTMLAPYGIFADGTLSVRVDLLLAPIMLGMQATGLSRTINRPSLVPISWLFVGWLLLIGANTLASDRPIDFIGAYGYVRLMIVMIVFSWIPWRAEDVGRFQLTYVLTSIPIGLLSIGQLAGVPLARTLSEICYSPPTATVIERQAIAEQSGYLFRAVGVFGNVSPAATYFLLTICLTISLFCSPFARHHKVWLVLALTSSLGGGLATMSGTFIGGIAVVLLIALVNAEPRRRRKIIFIVAGTAAMLAVAIMFTRARFDFIETQLNYQWERITGGHLLTNRYSTSEGILADAIEELQDHLLLGMGWTTSESFTGDSVYFSIIYSGGILGSLLFALGLYRLTLAALRRPAYGRWALSWTVVLLLGGIGCTTLVLGRLADGWWAMQGMLVFQLATSHRPGLSFARGGLPAPLATPSICRPSSPAVFATPTSYSVRRDFIR